jgi:hypothetical protein
VCPGVLAQHEKHQDKNQSQEINVDRASTVVPVVAPEYGLGVEGHGNVLEVVVAGEFLTDDYGSIRRPPSHLSEFLAR